MANPNSMNFNNQFFQKEHYKAFEPQKQDGAAFDNERMAVADRLLELDRIIWPEILKHGWHLNHHYMQEHWTSLWRVSQSRSNKLDAVWLHYGKSEQELEPYRELELEGSKETFIYHIRLQLVVRNKEFEIGLILGKNDGGSWDRDNYNKLMKNPRTREEIFNLLSKLDSDYWLDFKSALPAPFLNTFKTANELWEYTRNDNIKDYFTFGKSILPNDERISNDNIQKTIIDEFKNLYPLYNLIKHRF